MVNNMDKSFEKYIYDTIQNYIEDSHRYLHRKFITPEEHKSRIALLKDIRYKFLGRYD